MTESRRSLFAILAALAIAFTYRSAREALYARAPVTEHRALPANAPAEDAAAPSSAPDAEGWVNEYRYAGRSDGKELWARGGQERFRQDWWLARDERCALLRLAALAACLAAAWLAGGLPLYGWTLGRPARGLALVVIGSAGYPLWHLGDSGPREFSQISLPMLALLNLPVGFFEEACFRGLLFVGLARRLGPRPAALLSSLIFMLWHFGAQPVSAFPMIFLFGVLACAGLHLGVGIPVLALIHAALDTADMGLVAAVGSSYWLVSFGIVFGAAALGLSALESSAQPPRSTSSAL